MSRSAGAWSSSRSREEPPIALADVPDAGGLDWSPDGELIVGAGVGAVIFSNWTLVAADDAARPPAHARGRTRDL